MKAVTSKMVRAILVTGLAVTTMIGCADNNKDNGNRVRAAGNNATGTAPNAQTQYGSITATASVTNDVATLLGGVGQNQLGTINPTGSIFMWGKVYFPNGANMDSTRSFMGLQIYDSLAISGQSQVIQMSIGNNALGSGTIVSLGGSNYQVNIQFVDQAGWIRLQGNAVWGANFSGTITYGMNSGASGTLGQFTIPTCSFLNCQQ